MKLVVLTIAAISLSFFTNLKAQTGSQLRRELAIIDSAYKLLCDSGMVGQEEDDRYGMAMDTLLKTAYRRAVKSSTDAQTHLLKVGEHKWLREREAHVTLYERNVSEGTNFTIRPLLIKEERNYFTRKRVLYLIGEIDLVSIDSMYQNCADSATLDKMCAVTYKDQMDSLLAVVYRDLQRVSDYDQKASLKTDENLWLKKRNALFKKMDKKLDQTGDHIADVEDFMPVYEAKAKFIRNRVLYLIKQLTN